MKELIYTIEQRVMVGDREAAWQLLSMFREYRLAADWLLDGPRDSAAVAGFEQRLRDINT